MKKPSTVLEREHERKKKLAKQEEIIELTGQESEIKARKWVKEVAKEEEKKANKVKEFHLETLDAERSKYKDYRELLLKMLFSFIKEVGLPNNYEWGVWYDGKGVRFSIKTPDNEIHQRAFKPSYSPTHDLNACNVFAYFAEKVYTAYEEKCLQNSLSKN